MLFFLTERNREKIYGRKLKERHKQSTYYRRHTILVPFFLAKDLKVDLINKERKLWKIMKQM